MVDVHYQSLESIDPMAQKFTPVPYRADGSVSFGGGMQLVGILGMLGIVLGITAGYLSRFFYLVILFPLVIGGCIGAVGSRCIRKFHVRNPLLCGTAGFVAGCLAMLTMHYTEFRHFENVLNQSLGAEGQVVREVALRFEEIRANWDQANEVEQAIVKELEADPDGLRALRVDNLWRYIDMMAHNGVELNNGPGAQGGGINLGYVGSYIYWAIEVLIVAGTAYSLMSNAAGAPYCAECGQWKTASLHGPLQDAPKVSRHIAEGHLIPFFKTIQDSPHDAFVTLYICPECESSGNVDVQVERWTVNRKQEVSKKKLGMTTYPPEALPVLRAVCTPPEEESPRVDSENEDANEDALSAADGSQPA